jgi:hypothetical protein
MNFELLTPYLEYRMQEHHELYCCKCKAEYLEEHFAYALTESGYGTDWKPDFSHKVGKDQTTNSGVRCSNKSGTYIIKNKHLIINGSRTTKYKTLNEKLNFLSKNHQDYIFCMATTNEKIWNNKYYFIVLDSNKLDYHNQTWSETYGIIKNKGELSGWECQSDYYSAKISKSMSDQLWTEIYPELFEYTYEITVQ